MQSMFARCSLLTSFDISNFEMSNVSNISFMFDNCLSLTEINIGNFDIDTDSNIIQMFYKCSELMSITYSGTIEQFQTKNINTRSASLEEGTIIHCSDGDYTSVFGN